MKVGIYGLGNIGTALKCLLEKNNIIVKGYDTKYDADTVNDVNTCDIIWICVDTPTENWGDDINDEASDFDYSNLKQVLSCIDTNVPVIVGCTVSPGICRSLDYNGELYYVPFLISQGDIETGLISPDCWFVGCEQSADKVINLISKFSNSPVNVGTYEEAELAKALYNSWIIQKINFANWAGDLAYRLDANGQKIMEWLKNSSQLITSPKYMTPGWGDGGPCHPRDNLMMSNLNEKLNLLYDPAMNNHLQRLAQAKTLAQRILATGLPAIILGKSYKTGIDSTLGSYSLVVANYIQELGGTVYFEDHNEPGDYCYVLAHNQWYGHKPSSNSCTINLWIE